jgi:UDP-N-acetylglucosamine 2-epimerase
VTTMSFTTKDGFELKESIVKRVCEKWNQRPEYLPLLVDFFLWDKVSRAQRLKHNICSFESGFEAVIPTPKIEKKSVGFKSVLKKLVKGSNSPKVSANKNKIYIPVYSKRLNKVVNRLVEKEGYVVLCPAGANTNLTLLQGEIKGSHISSDILNELVELFQESLNFYHVELLGSDFDLLKVQIHSLGPMINQVLAHFDHYTPDMVLVHADNHPPMQVSVLEAKKRGIPVVMLQHGLDCELYYLDMLFADYVGVWGENRKQRYLATNQVEDSRLVVTGYPEYDNLKLNPFNCDSGKNKLLWLARPHNPEKCYQVNRFPNEGEQILNSFINILNLNQDLVLSVKLHPMEKVHVYHQIIEESGMIDRIQILDKLDDDSFDDILGTFCEDSTMALEMMFRGLPVVHLNFSNDPSSLNLESYEAVLPAFNEQQLGEAIINLKSNSINVSEMEVAQKNCVSDFVHKLDGQSTIRFCELIKEVVSPN